MSPHLDSLNSLTNKMTAWRRDFHQHPELSGEESRTATVVADALRGMGLEVHERVGGYGVIGVLRKGGSANAIALRADMDALPIQEASDLPYRSREDGKMHACGHDGHMAMLLGAASYLAEHGKFDGTVNFVFQPAEEVTTGASEMIRAGLFDRFPVSAIYGMHNAPGVPVGRFGTCTGALMAGVAGFKIEIAGQGTHAATPHKGIDPIVVASRIVDTLQTIVSREVDPLERMVLSVTTIHGGTADNVIPETVSMSGCVRATSSEAATIAEHRMRRVIAGVCRAHDATFEFDYDYRCPPVNNSPRETDITVAAARALVGDENVSSNVPPAMGSEDFAFFQEKCPGSIIAIGNGSDSPQFTLHHPEYNFNDEILPIGAAYWVQLVEIELDPCKI